MERAPRTLADAVRLLKLADLLKESVLTVVNEWAEESYPELARTGKATTNGTTRNSYSSEDTPRILPSRKLHQAQRTILGITGAVTELVVEPQSRIQELGCQYLETRALFIVTERRVPDLLDEAGEEGLEVQKLAEQTGIESHKLCEYFQQFSVPSLMWAICT